ncbi:hypothetical protein NL522_26695, partial [Klebsiella pneumoniae]|nr:hypothetical protein [Klebsiella pneumoniae]
MRRRVATVAANPGVVLVGFAPGVDRGGVSLVRTPGLHAAGKGINVAKVGKDPGRNVPGGGLLGKDSQERADGDVNAEI